MQIPIPPIPDYIRFRDERWRLAESLTVAEWRRAQRAAVERNDKHSLHQFGAAAWLLNKAKALGLSEDENPMARIIARPGEVDAVN